MKKLFICTALIGSLLPLGLNASTPAEAQKERQEVISKLDGLIKKFSTNLSTMDANKRSQAQIDKKNTCTKIINAPGNKLGSLSSKKAIDLAKDMSASNCHDLSFTPTQMENFTKLIKKAKARSAGQKEAGKLRAKWDANLTTMAGNARSQAHVDTQEKCDKIIKDPAHKAASLSNEKAIVLAEEISDLKCHDISFGPKTFKNFDMLLDKAIDALIKERDEVKSRLNAKEEEVSEDTTKVGDFLRKFQETDPSKLDKLVNDVKSMFD